MWSVQTRHHITSIPWAPFQLHAVVLAAFASLVAPFGGFFASGFKRAFGIKGEFQSFALERQPADRAVLGQISATRSRATAA